MMSEHNFIKKYTYNVAMPIAKVFIKINLTANQVTFLSFISSILSAYFLIYENSPLNFCVFWLINIILDFTDGTLARLSGKKNNGVLRVDHLTDVLKYGIIWIATGFRYLDNFIWAAVAVCCFSHLYFIILSHDFNRFLSKENNANRKLDDEQNKIMSFIYNYPLLRNIYQITLTIDGHCLFYFLVLPFGKYYAVGVLFYFSFISILRSLNIIRILSYKN
tara:strand:+ start:1258 stop:1917 length:660 start_codon:yes stop_codon:yes gene_type:complete